MSTEESKILHDIRLALGREKDLVLWRLNQAKISSWLTNALIRAVPELASVRVLLSKAVSFVIRRIGRLGLVPGASDLIGVGPGGLFLGLEVKSPRGTLSWEQTSWLCLVRERGGLAAVVRSAEEAHEALRRFRNGLHSWEGWPWIDI